MMTALGYLVLACLAVSLLVCYRHPWFAMVLVLILYPLKQLQMTYMPLFLQHSAWFNYIICAGVLVAAVSNVSRDRTALIGYFNRYFGLILFLYFYAWFAILYSPSAQYGFERARDGAPYWGMQMLLVPLIFSRVADIEKFFTPFMFIASVVIVLFLTNPGATWRDGRLMLQLGFFMGVADYRGNPLATAQMGGMLAIISALMLPRRAGAVWGIVRLGTLFLGLGIAIAAGSRGQLILSMLTIALFWPVARHVANIKQFFTTVFGFGAAAGVSLIALRFFLGQNREQSQRWDPQTQVDTVIERSLQAWRLIEAWATQPAKWVFGLGTNAYSSISGEAHSYAHNFYVEMLGELGLLGLTCGIVVTWWAWKLCKELWQNHRHDTRERATVGVLLALCAYNYFLALKQGTFVGTPDVWFLLAIACKLVYPDRLAAAAGWEGQLAPASDSYIAYEDDARASA